ncbi:nuclear transport factor 2 family protein [Nocardia sp. NPDC046473]|uniref:YybH family protein n=1 Tax=Nocardia sp. NPDC046473 TaxID=3155733 RepID=UPI0033CC2945
MRRAANDAEDRGHAGGVRVLTAVETVAAAHVRWLWGWDRQQGDPPFDLRAVQGEFYDWDAEDVLLYDDADPEHRVARSAEEYRSLWEPVFERLVAADHRLADGPHVLVSGDLAASRLVFLARLVSADGTETGLRATSSLTWRRAAAGWRIVWDHTSSVAVDGKTLAALMDSLPGSDR